MHTFNSRRVDKNLKLRPWFRCQRYFPRLELYRDIRFKTAVFNGLEKVGAQGCLNHFQVTANNIVFTDIVDLIQGRKNFCHQSLNPLAAGFTCIAGIKIAFKQRHQIARNIQITGQGIGNKYLAVGNA